MIVTRVISPTNTLNLFGALMKNNEAIPRMPAADLVRAIDMKEIK